MLFIPGNSSNHQSFVYTLLNDQTVLFQTTQFSICNLSELSLNAKQFFLTQGQDPIRCYHSEPKCTWKRWQWRGTTHSPKSQHYESLTISMSSVILTTFILGGWGLTPLYSVFCSPTRLGCTYFVNLLTDLSSPVHIYLSIYLSIYSPTDIDF